MNRKTVVAIVAGSALVVGTWAWAQQSGPGPQGGPGTMMGQGGMGPGGMMGQQGGMGSGGMMGPGMMGGQGPQGGMGMGPGMMGPQGHMGGGGQSGPGMGPGGSMMGGGSRLLRPLISEILSAKEQLALTADQEKRLRGLRSEFEKEAIRRGAEIRAAGVDLRDLLAVDAPDLGRVETQVKKIAALEGDLRFARIRVLQEGLAVLTKDQRQKFEALAPRQGPMGPGRGREQRGQAGPQGGANVVTRTDANGPVTVVATLLPLGGDRVAFEVRLDTHSGDLDSYKPEAAVTLRNDRGESAPAAVESPSGSGHHRAATLGFPASLAAGGAKYVELVVRDLGGMKERVLRWDGPFAGR